MSAGRRVGIIGLGAMGRPIADALTRAGYGVVGYDLSDAARAAHVDAGGIAAEDVAAVAHAADVILTSLPSARAVHAVLAEIGATGLPRTVVETSTLTLGEKMAARTVADDSGLVLLDSPLSGTSAQAASGDVVAYLSYDGRPDLTAVEPIMSAFARTVYHVGPFGNGTKTKLVANSLVAVHNLAAAEALLLAERSGLDPAATLEAVQDGAGGSKMLRVRGPLMLNGAYEPATASVDIFVKDLGAIRDLAAASGTPMPLVEETSAVYATAARQGRGTHDAACVYEVLRTSPTDSGKEPI
ncbi:NAD(P)-dependent oxidoreductase [Microbacterium sp. RD1]|uniref:NAD(P)-dependent oxidoreductase n=1 Tax=Microbacterium sp. RD1 TaxID=3457313 RepID=UPI003FA5EC93